MCRIIYARLFIREEEVNTMRVFSMTVPFAKGSISVQVRVTGDAISPAHLARVRRYLELVEQDWEGEAASPEAQPEEGR